MRTTSASCSECPAGAGSSFLSEELSAQWGELASALGQLVISFSRLEYRITGLVACYLGDTRRSARHATGAVMSFRQMADFVLVLHDLYLGKNHKLTTNVYEVVRKMRDFEETRNRLLHSMWAIGGSEWLRTKAKHKRGEGLRITEEVAKPKDIAAVADEILFFSEGIEMVLLMHQLEKEVRTRKRG